MGCVSDKCWELFPDILSSGLSLQEREDGVETKVKSIEFPFEKVFPVYAMGLSKPDTHSVANSDHDPIWDAVREEAKLEVPIFLVTCSFFFS